IPRQSAAGPTILSCNLLFCKGISAGKFIFDQVLGAKVLKYCNACASSGRVRRKGLMAMPTHAARLTVLSIRNILVAAVALLSTLALACAGAGLMRASSARQAAEASAAVDATADLLLDAAASWARERGATTIAVNAAGPSSAEQVQAIAGFRS